MCIRDSYTSYVYFDFQLKHKALLSTVMPSIAQVENLLKYLSFTVHLHNITCALHLHNWSNELKN